MLLFGNPATGMAGWLLLRLRRLDRRLREVHGHSSLMPGLAGRQENPKLRSTLLMRLTVQARAAAAADLPGPGVSAGARLLHLPTASSSLRS